MDQLRKAGSEVDEIIHQILEHIGVDAEPPGITPARGPPLWKGFDVPMGNGSKRPGSVAW